jgi:peroxiredoxin
LAASQAGLTRAREIADFRLPDHVSKDHALSDFADHELVVVAFLGTECPLARLYAGRLQVLADEYAERGVAVIAVMSNVQDSRSEIAAYVRKHNLHYPVLKDSRNEVANMFGAERTPQVFLLDRQRAVRYEGRIDDQYLVGVVRNKPTREDLRIAIDELLGSKPISTPKTDVVGCIIGRSRDANPGSPITFSHDVAPILQKRCVECHRAGEIGPFTLNSYDEAAGWGEMIAEVVREGRMPPWHAEPKFGTFANDRRMPDGEKELIYQWVANGCPEGDPADLPEPRHFTEGWQLPREPDVVLAMTEPFEVPTDAGPEGVPYQRFRVPTGFTEDKWITASEIRPGNRAVVHHTIVYVGPPGSKNRRDWTFLAGYVPGLRYDPLPAGTAKRVPAGSEIVFEMHYTPNGSLQTDRTEIGLLFADIDENDKDMSEVITTEIGNDSFEIPPGAADHVVTATSQPTDKELTLLSMSPHMHLRGKAFRYELVTPDGNRETLLDVPAYDFNWQTRYRLAEPRVLPAGSVIHCRAVFDNSEANLANPDPTQPVRWGEQSWEEMMLGFFDILMPPGTVKKSGKTKKPATTGLDVVGLFDAGDTDHNGGLSEAEVAGHELLKEHFAAIDQDQDQQLQLGEILLAMKMMPGRRNAD